MFRFKNGINFGKVITLANITAIATIALFTTGANASASGKKAAHGGTSMQQGQNSAVIMAATEYGRSMKERLYKISDRQDISDDEKLGKMVSFVMGEMDLDRMAKKVLGQHFKELSPKDQERYLKEFRVFLFDNLKANAHQALLVKSKDVKLDKNIVQISNKNFDIVYRIHSKDSNFNLVLSVTTKDENSFKIINMSVDNIDIVGNQSSMFKNHIEENGLKSIFDLMSERL